MPTSTLRTDEMTDQQRAANRAAVQDLVRGKYYRFDPPVTSIGFPVGGPGVCAEQEMEFVRGWYIGFVKDKHVFQGKPINDQRDMLSDDLRECYFHVLFIGGSKAIPDD